MTDEHAAPYLSPDQPEIVTVRWFAAPVALVYACWTDPDLLAEWWGPVGFTNPRVELEVRPGGRWHIDMWAPDGTIYPNKGEYLDVVAEQKLVWTDIVEADETAWGDNAPPSSINTVLFEEIEGRTKLTMISRLATMQARDRMVELGAVRGLNESLDRLDQLVRRG